MNNLIAADNYPDTLGPVKIDLKIFNILSAAISIFLVFPFREIKTLRQDVEMHSNKKESNTFPRFTRQGIMNISGSPD